MRSSKTSTVLSNSNSTSFLTHKNKASYSQLNAKKIKPPLGKDIRSIKSNGKANDRNFHNKSQSFNFSGS